MSGRPEADQSRSKALCIMNFRSFSMFDLVDPLSSRESIRDSRSKDSRKNSHRCLSLSDVRKDTVCRNNHKPGSLREFTGNRRSSFQIMVDRKETAAVSGKTGTRSFGSVAGVPADCKDVRRSVKSPRKMISAGKLSVMAAVILLLLTMSLILRIFMGTGTDVRAGIPLSEVQYKVVEIKYGDTLWSIARNNMNPGYSSIKDYISDIKDCNQMTSDNLTTGGYLMIPYYEYIRDDTL